MEGTSLVPTEDAQLPAPAVPRPVPDARKEFPIWETAWGKTGGWQRVRPWQHT